MNFEELGRAPMKKIYLATPYTHDNEVVRMERAEGVTVKAAQLIEDGFAVFSPITHGHAIGDVAPHLPHDWEYWGEVVTSYIKDWADELWVFMQPGWEESVGVLAEIGIAAKADKPIKFIKVN
ncbi:DUF1937 family protein [Pseudodesulfovibrio sp. JC047]|uniref:DUF1937 family protein n=1 Tax=Pseudodesulfovibrio sp. JC047 TaxID=2683199 RepID=UPI0013D23A5E|nr:DUF1937 family protein [Pseudodesulfovibrio sp. JC047]NDV20842.1 DUF1937 family protein [Pseudodesulfovibrio sp. JC047]